MDEWWAQWGWALDEFQAVIIGLAGIVGMAFVARWGRGHCSGCCPHRKKHK